MTCWAMKGGRRAKICGVTLTLAAALVAAAELPVPASANGTATADESAKTFGLTWWSVDGGGAVSTGGAFGLTSAMGQPDVGFNRQAGISFDAGVWSTESGPAIFCDGFESGGTGAWSAAVGASR